LNECVYAHANMYLDYFDTTSNKIIYYGSELENESIYLLTYS